MIGLVLGGWHFRRTQPPQPPTLVLEGIDPDVAIALRRASGEVETHPRSAQAWGTLGELLFANDFYTESLVCLGQAEAIEPSEVSWPYLQGLVLLFRDPPAAVAPLTRAAQRNPKALVPSLRLAETLLAQDDLSGAEPLFRTVLDLEPSSQRALLGLGLLAQRQGRWADSVPLLEKAIPGPYAAKAAHTALAVAHLRLENLPAADRHRREAEGVPRDVAWPDPYFESIDRLRMGLSARVDRVDRLLAYRQFGPAFELLQEILTDHPESDEARLELAQTFIHVGKWNEAERELRRLIADHPAPAATRFLLGMVLLQKKNPREAETEFRRAIELQPSLAMAYFNLGRCLEQQDKKEEATKAYRDSLRYRPQLVEGHVALARLLREKGDHRSGRAHLQQAIRLQPTDPLIKQAMEVEAKNWSGNKGVE